VQLPSWLLSLLQAPHANQQQHQANGNDGCAAYHAGGMYSGWGGSSRKSVGVSMS